ncbi:MAG: SusC/RagA family TonB-linked outer membrane protein, partial [bacterium]
NVLVQGLDYGAATNTDGEFTISGVPVGERSVIARFIGYKSTVKVVNVVAGDVAELNFDLGETVLTLDEVVVTGAGVAAEKRKLGNTVATLHTEALQAAPISTFSDLLSAREAGVNILPSGGLAGQGARIRIRGASSLSQSLEPVVYLDGIRINNGAGFSLGAGGGGAASRLDDINPDAIERVEILKGAAAATLYGTQASSGIIQIFTKKGSFGKPRFNLEIEQSAVQFPDRYHPNTGFARSDAQAKTMSDVFGFTVRPWELVTRTSVKDMFATGHGQTYSLSVSGGGSGVTYFASSRFQNTDGPLNPSAENFKIAALPDQVFDAGGTNDLVRRTQFTANVNIIPSNKLNVRINTGYSNVHNELPENGNNIFGLVSLAMFGKPERVSYDPGDGSSINNAQGTRAFATVREATFQEVKEDANHAYVSLAANYKFTKELGIEANFGIDYTNERAQNFQPFRWNVDNFSGQRPEGSTDILKRDRKEWTIDVKTNWSRDFTSDISSALVVGFQGFQTSIDVGEGFGTTFPGPGLETLSATDAPTQQALSSFSEVINAGVFFQEQVGYKDYLYLTGGVRLDASSAFGDNFSTQTYPKLSASFIPSTAFSNTTGSFLSTLRIRAAIGKSGQQPSAFDHLTTFNPESSAEGPGVSPGNVGNANLKPEVSTEIEAGFDAGLLEDRLGLEFTFWDRTIKDALVERQFPISGGFLNRQLDNIGEIEAHGFDISMRFSAVSKPDLSIDVFANAAYITEEVTDMGGAPPLKAGGSYPRYRNFVEEGFAPGAHLGAKLDRSLEFPIDLNNDGVPESRDDLLAFFADPRQPTDFKPVMLDEDGDGDFLDHYLGKPTPDWSGSFGLNIGFMKRFRFASVFEYKAGNYQVNNLTDAFRKSHGLIGRNTPEAAARELTLLNPASTAEQRLQAANEWVREFLALSPYSGLNTIEDADFIRLREISLAYDVPRNIARTFGLNNMTVSVSGRNLLMITGYSGIDQEMNAIGRRSTGGRDNNFLDGVDAFGFPIPRQFVFKIRAGF